MCATPDALHFRCRHWGWNNSTLMWTTSFHARWASGRAWDIDIFGILWNTFHGDPLLCKTIHQCMFCFWLLNKENIPNEQQNVSRSWCLFTVWININTWQLTYVAGCGWLYMSSIHICKVSIWTIHVIQVMWEITWFKVTHHDFGLQGNDNTWVTLINDAFKHYGW